MKILALQQLAPKGVVRAAVNLANTLLVSRHGADGEPSGIAPDLARWIAGRLSVPCICVPFASPSELVAAAGDDAWDICLIAADPQRANTIAFTRPYVEIEATYLVHDDSAVRLIDDVDQPRVRIAAVEGSAYALWLARHLVEGELVLLKSPERAQEAFMTREVDVLAGLRPSLDGAASTSGGTRLLDGRFMAIPQSVGTHRRNDAGLAFLRAAVDDALSSGFVAKAIAHHRIAGLNVASAPAE